MDNYKILIIDDDPQSLQILNSYLSEINSSFNISKVSRSEKALKLAKSKLPDLIITDWEMPVMDGLELTKNLKEDELTKDIPVIIITGIMLTSESIKNAFDAGATDYISKPFTKNELAARVKSVLTVRKYIKEVQKLNADKSKFCSVVANDLNYFFEKLFSFTDSIKGNIEKGSAEKAIESLNKLTEKSKQTFNSSQNLKYWSDFQQGIFPFKPEKISLNNLISELKEQYNDLSIRRNIVFDIVYKQELKVYADKKMLMTVLKNLIDNAFKYTKEKGHIILQVDSEGDFAEFGISDDGIGISSKKAEELFMFDHIDSTPGLNDERGFGLGLILCKDFIEKNKGEIKADSKVKKGSKLIFTIPFA